MADVLNYPAWKPWVALLIFRFMFCYWYASCKQWLILILHKLWGIPGTYMVTTGKKEKVNIFTKSTNLSPRAAKVICWGLLNMKTYSSTPANLPATDFIKWSIMILQFLRPQISDLCILFISFSQFPHPIHQ